MRQGFILKFFLKFYPVWQKSGQNIFFASGENVFLLFSPQKIFFISGSSVRLIRDATSLIRPPPVKKTLFFFLFFHTHTNTRTHINTAKRVAKGGFFLGRVSRHCLLTLDAEILRNRGVRKIKKKNKAKSTSFSHHE